MANVLEIPRLNVLRFVRTDNQATNIVNFDNRLLHQEDYRFYYEKPYYQKFNIADPILTQISTNYALPTTKLVNAITTADTTLTAWATIKSVSTESDGTVTFYDLTIDTTYLSGYYYITMTFTGGIVYQSEYFHVGDYSDYTKVQYTHSEIGEFKGIYFSGVETFVFRLDSRLVEVRYGLNKVTNESFNARLENLTTDAKRYAVLELDALPRYIIQLLNVALQIDTLIINNVYYQVEEGLETEFVKEGNIATNMYTGNLILREVEFEVYENIVGIEEIETFYELINELGDAELIDSSDIELIAG
jgi:hypothetical protein